MSKGLSYKLAIWGNFILVSLLIPLLINSNAWAQKNCRRADVNGKIEQLKDDKKRKTASDELVLCGESAIPSLTKALSNGNELIRMNVALIMGKVGGDAEDGVPGLVEALGDSNERVRSNAASALYQIARAVEKEADNFNGWDLEAVESLEELKQSLDKGITGLKKDKREWKSKKEDIDKLDLVGDGIGTSLKQLKQERAYQVIKWIVDNPWAWVAAGGVAGSNAILLGIFIFDPIFLLKLDKWVKPASLKISKINLEVSLSDLLLFLKYHPRVLDCWVAEHLDQVKSDFLQQPTVSDRAIHIPIQIKLGKKLLDYLAPQDLRLAFSQSPVCLLIVGEGGVGKTSLAYQIARWGLGLVGEEATEGQSLCSHHMLPVLIEKELEDTSLLTAIKEQLPRTPEGNFIADELLKALLKRRRVLVILDHVSEMSEQSYNKMKQALSETPVNALIITSRLREKDLDRSQKTWLEPQKIEGAKLSNFIQPYLKAQDKKDIFEDDAEFYRTCTRLATMMAATVQSATALLVRMYVDQVIEVGGLKTALLADDIPTLMVKYLEWLNRDDAIDKAVRQDDSVVLQASKTVAWVCLRDNYYPTEARYEDVIQALTLLSQAENPEQDAKERLIYLQKTLCLVQRSANRVKILLDPVAEYLAAFKVVAVCQQEGGEEPWKRFLQTVDVKDISQIRGFLLAVRNCYEQEQKIQEKVLEELNKRANLDSQELENVRRRNRINRMIDDLYDSISYATSKPKYLEKVIRDLQEEGEYAKKAIPDLMKVLNSDKLEAKLRVKTLNALMQIQVDTEKRKNCCREVLAACNNPSELRAEAIKALLNLGSDLRWLEELLQSYFQDEMEVGVVRVQVGEGLRKLGVLRDLLVVELSENATPRIKEIPQPQTWVLELAKGIELVMVRIPGGTFWMGLSPREGFDAQHEVTVPEFWMSQFLVTQAQYEAVMGNNPATFQTNGSNCPVETVSWHDAVDFCRRLSELKSQEFRLPSEAEWEYACRAKTTTPFYFGETITTDYANYRGTDWDYGGKTYSLDFGQKRFVRE